MFPMEDTAVELSEAPVGRHGSCPASPADIQPLSQKGAPSLLIASLQSGLRL